MVCSTKIFSCHLCNKTFSSAQRLSSHLNRKNPCHVSLVPKTDDSDKNIIEYNDSTEYQYINPYQEAINNIDKFNVESTEVKEHETICSYCHKKFKNKKGLSYHLASCVTKKEHNILKHTKLQEFITKCKEIIHGQAIMLAEKNKKLESLEEIIHVDNITKSEIIAHQTTVQEKTVDALTYLQKHHKNTPKLEFPDVQLTDEEVEKYIYTSNPLFNIVKILLLEGKSKEEVSMWCLDATREKFAIKDDKCWDVEYGCKRLVDFAFNTIHNQFQKYALKRSSEINMSDNSPKIYEIIDLSNRVIDMHNEKARKAFVRDACNEFNVHKLFDK